MNVRCPAVLRPLLLLSFASGIATGCTPAFNIDQDNQFRCTSDTDCPTGTTCQLDAGFCVLPGVVLDVTGPVVTDVVADARVIGATQQTAVTLTFDEPIAALRITGVDSADLTIATTTATVLIRGDGRDDGPVVLELEADDAEGNTRTSRVEAEVRVDAIAPSLVADLITILPSRDNILFPGRADAARADSTVEVTANADEAITVLAVRIDDSDVTDDVEVTQEGERVRIGVPGDVRTSLGDGSLAIELDVVDAVENPATLTLSSTLVIDTTPPPAPTVDRLRRQPFGAAAPGESNDIVTLAEGTATEAILVLALPGGVDATVDAVRLNVGRSVIGEDGAFSLPVPVDIPGLQTVAVDAAGNLSAAAVAAQRELVASLESSASPHQLQFRPLVSDALVQKRDVTITGPLRDEGSVTSTSPPIVAALTTERQDGVLSQPLLAEDPINGGVLVVSGGQTFRYHHHQLERLEVPGIPARVRAAMATDFDRGVVVLFGGESAEGDAQNSVFEFDGTRWREVVQNNPTPAADQQPRPRIAAGMGYVPGLGVVVGGGCGNEDSNFLGCQAPIPFDLWAWNGTAFTQLCAAGTCGDTPDPLSPNITHDGAGTVVVHGGLPNLLESAEGPAPPPRLRRLIDGALVASCSGECALNVPGTGVARFVDGALHVIGECHSVGTCDAVVTGETAVATPLAGLDVPQNAGDNFQARSLVRDIDTDMLVFARDATQLLGLHRGDDVLFNAFPALMTPRSLGAMVVDDDGTPSVLAGCSSARADHFNRCTTPASTRERVLAPGVVVDSDIDISGEVTVAQVGDEVLVVSSRAEGGSGIADVRLLSDLTATPTSFPLPAPAFDNDVSGGTVVGLIGGATRAIVIGGFARFEGGAFVVSSLTEPSRFLDSSGTPTVACASGCGLSGVTATGVAAAALPGGGGILFGGQSDEFGTNGVLLVDDNGVGISADIQDRPPARAFASATFDPVRQRVWLTGGGAQTFGVGGSCGGGDAPNLCQDLWTFDGNGFERVQTEDLIGSGQLPGRMGAQMVSTGGGFVISGGVNGGNSSTRTDAWQVRHGPQTRPAHLLQARFSPYGDDATGDLRAVEVVWCGEASDAAGNAVDVDVRVFDRSGFVAIPMSADGACRRGAVTGETLTVLRDVGLELTIDIAPRAGASGAGLPSITTEHLTATGVFVD